MEFGHHYFYCLHMHFSYCDMSKISIVHLWPDPMYRLYLSMLLEISHLSQLNNHKPLSRKKGKIFICILNFAKHFLYRCGEKWSPNVGEYKVSCLWMQPQAWLLPETILWSEPGLRGTRWPLFWLEVYGRCSYIDLLADYIKLFAFLCFVPPHLLSFPSSCLWPRNPCLKS